MALTLDGMLPVGAMGGTSSGLGVGAGALGGGVAGLLLGGLLANNGNGGLFGGNNNTNNDVQFDAIQSQINNLSGQLSSGDIQDSISKISTEIGNVATAQAAANFTTLSSINGLGRDLVTNLHQTDLTQLNSFNQLTTTTLQGFNGIAMQSQNATNQIIAQGTANAAAMAQCCCEIKSTILADGNATRALINQLDKENLQAQLSSAKAEVSNLAQTIKAQEIASTQTGIILNHLMPRPVVA